MSETDSPKATIAALYRHPVKGFSPEPLDAAQLEAGGHFPGDRRYAVENGPSDFDPAAPVHRQKIFYLMLMRNPRLAALKTRLADDGRTFSLTLKGKAELEADLGTPEGRAALEDFLTTYMGPEARGPLKVLQAPDGFRFMDSAKSGYVSLLNLASVRDLEARSGLMIDPLRFRMNIHIDGWPAGFERDLIGRTLKVGDARLEVLTHTNRCAAVNANPATGERDLDLLQTLRNTYDHCDQGVYATIVEGGGIRRSDTVVLLS